MRLIDGWIFCSDLVNSILNSTSTGDEDGDEVGGGGDVGITRSFSRRRGFRQKLKKLARNAENDVENVEDFKESTIVEELR